MLGTVEPTISLATSFCDALVIGNRQLRDAFSLKYSQEGLLVYCRYSQADGAIAGAVIQKVLLNA